MQAAPHRLPTYEDWKARSKGFEELTLYRQWQPTMMAPVSRNNLLGSEWRTIISAR